MYTFSIEPIGKPRMTRADRWKKRDRVVRYYQFKDKLNFLAEKLKYKLTNELDIVCLIPMPDSWSKKKKLEMHGKPHQQKPDFDNIAKAFTDSLAGEDGDACIYDARVRKFWSEKPAIIVLERKEEYINSEWVADYSHAGKPYSPASI